jgi:hypothetical protein
MDQKVSSRITREIVTSFQGSLNSMYVSKYCEDSVFQLAIEGFIGDFLKELDGVIVEYDDGYGDVEEFGKVIRFNSFYFSVYHFYYHVKFAISKSLGIVDYVKLEDWINFKIWELSGRIDREFGRRCDG